MSLRGVDMDNDDLEALECWARGAVRRMLVRALLNLSQDFANDAKHELSMRFAMAAKLAGRM
jgi:hypothetical protein